MARRISLKNAPTPDELSEVWRIIALSGDTSMSSARIEKAVQQAVDIGAMRPEVAQAAKAYAVYGAEVLKGNQLRMKTGLPFDDELGGRTTAGPTAHGSREREELVSSSPKLSEPLMEEDIPSPILKTVKKSLNTKAGAQLFMMVERAGEEAGLIPGEKEHAIGVESRFLGRPLPPKTREEALEILNNLAIPRGGAEAKIQEVPGRSLRTGDEFDFTRSNPFVSPVLTSEQARELEKADRERIERARVDPKLMAGGRAETQIDDPESERLANQAVRAVERDNRLKQLRVEMERANTPSERMAVRRKIRAVLREGQVRVPEGLSQIQARRFRARELAKQEASARPRRGLIARSISRILGTEDIEQQSVLGTAATAQKGGKRGLLRSLLDALTGGRANSPYAKSRSGIAKRMAADKARAAARASGNEEPETPPSKFRVAGGEVEVERRKGSPRNAKPMTDQERAIAARRARIDAEGLARLAAKRAAQVQAEMRGTGPEPVPVSNVQMIEVPDPSVRGRTMRVRAAGTGGGIDPADLERLAAESAAVDRAIEARASRRSRSGRRLRIGGAHENVPAGTSRDAYPYVPKGLKKGQSPLDLLKGFAAYARRHARLTKLMEEGKIPRLPMMRGRPR